MLTIMSVPILMFPSSASSSAPRGIGARRSDRSFNEWHILAITQAICLYRKQQKIDGPLYLGIDTHALSRPALASALEVLPRMASM